MKTHRELVDGYLDASWALAMERVAIRQGDLAGELEECLNQDPGAAVPRHTVKRCRAAIRRAFSPPMKRAKAVLARVVITAVLCGLLTSAACAISPDFKEFLTRIFYSVTEVFTAFTLQDPQTEDIGALQGHAYEISGLRFEWLPEGYEYVDGEETERSQRVEFENKDSDRIRIRVMNVEDASAYTYDSQNGVGEDVKVGDFEGRLIEENGYLTLFWIDEEQGFATIILSTALPQEELLQLAESIRHQK